MCYNPFSVLYSPEAFQNPSKIIKNYVEIIASERLIFLLVSAFYTEMDLDNSEKYDLPCYTSFPNADFLELINEPSGTISYMD